MVDFAGKKYHYVDVQTGEQISCAVFVATLPYSGLIFCMAVPSQKTTDILEAGNGMLRYFGGTIQTVLSDNLRTAVTKSDWYESAFTDLYYQLSEHYGITFSATRPAKPRDKPIEEKAVNIVYRNVYAPLRHFTFSSLADINHHFRQQTDKINTQPYKGIHF